MSSLTMLLLNDLRFQVLPGLVLQKWSNLRKPKQRRDSRWMLLLSRLFLVSSSKCHLCWASCFLLKIIVVMLKLFGVMVMQRFLPPLIFDSYFSCINSENSDITTNLRLRILDWYCWWQFFAGSVMLCFISSYSFICSYSYQKFAIDIFPIFST